MDVGTQLHTTRRQRGITIEEIAASTKVSKQTLDHIDHNRFSQLPGGILTKGHLRAYAAAVGLNAEQIVRDYLAQCFDGAEEELPIAPRPPLEGEPRSVRILVFEVIAVAVVVAAWTSYRRPAESPAAARIEARALETGLQSALLERTALPDGPPMSQAESTVRIDIRPSGPCWVLATADGRVAVDGLLQSGDWAFATAAGELVLRVGNPETFVYWLNGARGRQLGEAGEPVTLRMTADDYEQFLADSASEPTPPSSTNTT